MLLWGCSAVLCSPYTPHTPNGRNANPCHPGEALHRRARVGDDTALKVGRRAGPRPELSPKWSNPGSPDLNLRILKLCLDVSAKTEHHTAGGGG